MGKKKVIKKTKEETLKERDEVEKKVKDSTETQKSSRRIKEAKAYISSSYNNTIITLTDMGGDVLGWKSAGSIGFKGTKKGTSFAASKVAEAITNICDKTGIKKIHVVVRGIGSGRDSALRSLTTHGLKIISIKDITPIPHNGCRPPKPKKP